jgi:hypothetical protein
VLQTFGKRIVQSLHDISKHDQRSKESNPATQQHRVGLFYAVGLTVIDECSHQGVRSLLQQGLVR